MKLDISKLWFEKLPRWVIKHNQSRLIIFVGPQGSGKSYATLSLGYQIMKENFDPRRNVAYFFLDDFRDKLEQMEKGEVLIWDDFGVGLDSRTFNNKEQIHLTQILETMRPMNLIVVFSTPDMGFVDVRARKLFHDFVEMKKIDYQRKMSYGKWYLITVDRWTGELRRKLPRIKVGERVVTVNGVWFKKPPESVTDIYDKERAKALEKLRKMSFRKTTKPRRMSIDMLPI